MKLLKASSARREGSILMVTLFAAVLIGTVLASYLTLIRHQSVAVQRSQGWNAAMALAEAGAEEAMAQINCGGGAPNNNGWGPVGASPSSVKSRTLPLMNGGYNVKFFSTGANQTIYSTGYVTIQSLGVTVSRSITVTTKAAPVIKGGSIAVGAKGAITFINPGGYGGGLWTDSFDSADPANSGHYPVNNPSKQLTNGAVGTVSGPITVGPGASLSLNGEMLLGPTVAVPGSPGTGRIHSDFNSDYPGVDAPAGVAGWLPAAPDTSGGKFTFSTGGKYIISDGIAQIIVAPGADVTLYVTATTFRPTGITIQTNNLGSGNLKIYQQSGTALFPGSGKTAVQSERAENLQYFGMPGVTSVTYEGNYNFFGFIYAPAANLALNGGWNSGGWSQSMNFVGAAVGQSIVMSGYYKFHFDENLLRPGVTGGGSMSSLSYVANTWKEDQGN